MLLSLLCLQDDNLVWGQRALQALNGIASHPVSFDFARAAAAPVASRQLAQAWQAFKAAVSRDASTPEHPYTAAQAVHVPNDGPSTSPSGAVEAAAADANVRMSKGMVLPEAGTAAKQMDPSDEADDEEVPVCLPPPDMLVTITITGPKYLPSGVQQGHVMLL